MNINEFARAIGVSTTTVSRAIHGRGRVSAATRRMVLERMQDLGYTPNLNAQRLSHGRTNLVALDFGPWRDYLSDMFFAALTSEIQDSLEAHDYGVLLSGPGTVLDRWVKTRAVDGVMLIGDPSEPRLPEEIAAAGTPCVVIGNHAVECTPLVGSVRVDLLRGAQQAARLLVERAHRRIGFLATDTLDDVFFGFRDALMERGLSLADECVSLVGHSPTGGAQGLCALLALPDPPTAVFARTDAVAAGAMRAAHRMGVRIPEDLSFIGHDDVPFAELVEPPLTTVRVDCHELARVAVDTLFALLSGPGAGLEQAVVHTRLVVRDSVSAPRLWALSYRESVRLVAHGIADRQAPA